MPLKFGRQVICWKILFELVDDNSPTHYGVSAQLGFTRKSIGSGYLLAQNHTMFCDCVPKLTCLVESLRGPVFLAAPPAIARYAVYSVSNISNASQPSSLSKLKGKEEMKVRDLHIESLL